MEVGGGNAGPGLDLEAVNWVADLQQFESLPRVVREAMANLPTDYACVGVPAMVRKYGVAVVAKHLKRMAAEEYREWFRAEFGCDYPGDAA